MSLGLPFSMHLNPYLTTGFTHHYQLDESTFIIRGRSCYFYFFSFFDEIPVSKQNSIIWEAAFCGVTSAALLFAYVPQKGRQALMS